MATNNAPSLRILVPLDGSPVAESAIGHALALAKAFVSSVCLLRVLEPDARFWASTETIDWQLRRSQAEAYLRRIANRLAAAGTKVDWRIEEGRAAEVILNLWRSGEANLVVMTRFGRGGASAFRFGGTVQKVVFSMPGSVMVVEPTGEPVSQYRHLLVPVDGSRQSEWSVGIAAMLARAHGSRITLLQVVERPRAADSLGATRELLQLAERMTELRHFAALRRGRECVARLPEGVAASSEVMIVDDAPLAIARHAEENDVDLIIMSVHGASESSPRAYGDVSSAVLEHCHRPVLVCRKPASPGAGNCFQSAILSESRADVG